LKNGLYLFTYLVLKRLNQTPKYGVNDKIFSVLILISVHLITICLNFIMPNFCCVPRCRSCRDSLKYGQDPIQKFDFPTDDTLRRAWVQAIRSVDKNCILRKDSSVCLAHFSPSDLSTDQDDQPPGKCIYRLQPGAVPSMFSGISYL